MERGALPRLKCIDLDENCIGDEGAKAIASALERGSFQALESLDLGSNAIGPDGAKALASALERGSFPRLQLIYFRGNICGSEGIDAFVSALRRASLPELGNSAFRVTIGPDDETERRLKNASSGARQRGRMLLFLGSESGRCNSPTKRFLKRDGDHAAMTRALKFMLP